MVRQLPLVLEVPGSLTARKISVSELDLRLGLRMDFSVMSHS